MVYVMSALQVADRLSQLLVFLGPEATLPDVLALTKRCPQVLQVSRTLLVQRLQLLCSMLGRDLVTEVSEGGGETW